MKFMKRILAVAMSMATSLLSVQTGICSVTLLANAENEITAMNVRYGYLLDEDEERSEYSNKYYAEGAEISNKTVYNDIGTSFVVTIDATSEGILPDAVSFTDSEKKTDSSLTAETTDDGTTWIISYTNNKSSLSVGAVTYATFSASTGENVNFSIQHCEKTNPDKLGIGCDTALFYTTGTYNFYYGTLKDDTATIDNKTQNSISGLGINGKKPTDTFQWSVSDESIATINESTGEFTALSPGTVIVTVEAIDLVTGAVNATKSESITVLQNNPASEIKILDDSGSEISSLEMLKGSTYKLGVAYSATNGNPVTDNYSLNWSSSDTKVLTVSDGVLTAVGRGKATILVKGNAVNENNQQISCSIDVQVNSNATSVSFYDETGTISYASDSGITIGTEKEMIISVVETPADANENITWEVDTGEENVTIEEIAMENPDDSNIRQLKIKGVTAGKCTLTIKGETTENTLGLLTITIKESVVVNTINITYGDTSVNDSLIQFFEGQTVTLQASPLSEEGVVTEDKINVSVSGNEDETVDYYVNDDNSITITGIRSDRDEENAPRQIQFIVGAQDKTATFSVGVLYKADSLKLSKTSESVRRDDSFELSAELLRLDGIESEEKLTWECDDPEVASITLNDDNTVTVRGLSVNEENSEPKSATITATSSTGLTASCEVKVYMVKNVTLNTNVLDVQNGSTGKLIATVNQYGGATGGIVKWTSSYETVATVDENGVITAVGIGTTTITAECGGQRDSAEITVWDNISNAEISGISETYTYIPGNGEIVPEPVVTYANKKIQNISASDDQEGYYTVSYTKNTTVGTATITITGDGKFYRGTTSTTFTIVPRDLSEASFAEIEDMIYSGSALKPTVVVSCMETELVLNTDYTVAYSNNINVCGKDAKENAPTVTITGKGNYTGTANATFTIAAYDISNCTVSVSSMTYTGEELQPAVAVKMDRTTLVEGTDYTLSYTNNINAGVGTVTVTGIGNYGKTTSAEFTINPRKINSTGIVISSIASVTYNGQEHTPAVEIKDGETLLTSGKDYTVSYSNNINAGTATVTITGTGNYTGSPTSAPKFTISPLSITDKSIQVGEVANQVYTKSAITPEVTVVYGETMLLLSTDYTVTYANNTNVCDKADETAPPTITIKGKGNFTDTRTVTFSITPYSIEEDCVIADIANQTYNGGEITPSITVKSESKGTLKLNTDYTVSYVDNVNAGTATIIVTGAGNYAGKLEKTFVIDPKPIISSNVASIGSQTYTGVAIEPVPVIKSGTLTLENGVDFDVAYTDNLVVGTALCTITAKGNYTGVFEKSFTIVQADIANAEVEEIPVQKYMNAEITPKPVVVYECLVLTETEDYTLTYSDNVAEGTASIVLKGINNFKGTQTVTFEIKNSGVSNPASINGMTVYEITEDGEEIVDDNATVYIDTNTTKQFRIELSNGSESCDDIALIGSDSTANAIFKHGYFEENKTVTIMELSGGTKPGTFVLNLATIGGKASKSLTVRVYQPATAITINSEQLTDISTNIQTVVADHKLQLYAVLSPKDATDIVKWSVENVVADGDEVTEDRATISQDGILSAKINGTVKVTASLCETETGERTVSQSAYVYIIQNNPATEVKIQNSNKEEVSEESFIVGESASYSVVATASYSGSATDVFTWSSSDEDVAVVDQNGFVTMKGPGNAIITVTAEDDTVNASVEIHVISLVKTLSIQDEAMTKTLTQLTVNTGNSVTISAVEAPATANEALIWEIDDPTIVELDVVETEENRNFQQAVLIGLKEGTCKLTVKTAISGIKSTCTITVNKGNAVNYILLENEAGDEITEAFMYVGDTETIVAKLCTEDGNEAEGSLTWTLSDDTLAQVTIDNQTITIEAIGAGSLTLTAIEQKTGIKVQIVITIDETASTTTESTVTTETTTTTTETTTTETETKTTTDTETSTQTTVSETTASTTTMETTSTTASTTNTTDITTVSTTSTTTGTEEVVCKGDANQDGKVDADDAYMVLVYYAEEMVGKEHTICDDPELEKRIVEALDIDQDGDLDADDAYLILLYYAQISVGSDVTWEDLM